MERTWKVLVASFGFMIGVWQAYFFFECEVIGVVILNFVWVILERVQKPCGHD